MNAVVAVVLLGVERDFDAVGTTAGKAATSQQHPSSWQDAADIGDCRSTPRPTTSNSDVVQVRTAHKKADETSLVQKPAKTLPVIFPWCFNKDSCRCLLIIHCTRARSSGLQPSA